MARINISACEKILLVVPVRPGYSGVTIDLGLLYLQSALKREGLQATILHCPKDSLDHNGFAEFLRRNKHIRIIGFKSYSVDHNSVLRMSECAKQIIPDVVTITGGPHPTSLPEYVLDRMPCMDYVYTGEGEIGFPLFCKSVLNGEQKDNIPGIVFRSAKGIICNPNRIYENLDELPQIDWKSVAIKEYPKFMTSLQFVPVMATRGCPYQCKYCAAHKVLGRRVRYRSVENVVDELRRLNALGVKEINFSDDEITLNRDYFVRLCRAIINSGLNMRWECSNGVRLDTLDSEVLDLMYDAGCRYVAVGIESASNAILKAMKKNITVETITEKIELIHRHKVVPQGLFMIGFPDETEEDIRNTIKFSVKLNISKTNFSIFMPLPGSEIFTELIEKGQISLDSLNWDEMRPDKTVWERNIPSVRLKQLQKEAYFKFYFRTGPVFRLISENIFSISGWSMAFNKAKSVFRS